MEPEKPHSAALKYADKVRIESESEVSLLRQHLSDFQDQAMFVSHPTPPAVGSMVLLELCIFGIQEPLGRIVAKVVYSRSAAYENDITAGMQLIFVELDNKAQEIIQRAAALPLVHAVSSPNDQPADEFGSFDLRTTEQRPFISMSGPIIGIDLGTVNTCIAVIDKGQPRIIRSQHGYETLPSVVYWDHDNSILVSHPALEKLIVEPTRCIYGSKRFLGRPYQSKEVRFLGHFFNYQLVAGQNGLTAAKIDEHVVSLEEVSGHILRAARQMASNDLKVDVMRAVITVPAYYGETQRQAVRDAAKFAGLYVERIINEPTAAAVAYGYRQSLNRTILVYDLGGGTFDASIMRLENDTLTVLATRGDPFLGGLDFDDRMTEYALMTFERMHKISLRHNPIAVQRLRFAAQHTKHELSDVSVASLDVPNILEQNGRSIDLHMRFEKRTLEDLTCDLVERTLILVDTILKEAQINATQLDDILLVGGQSRSPMVRQVLLERFGKKPSNVVDPDQAVALGAAIVADAIFKKVPVNLVDLLPGSIRIAVQDGNTKVLLNRGIRLPASKQFELSIPPNTNELKLILCRGEETLLSQNTPLGTLRLPINSQATVPQDPSSQLKAHITLQVNAEGMLSVDAHYPGSDANQQLAVSLNEP